MASTSFVTSASSMGCPCVASTRAQPPRLPWRLCSPVRRPAVMANSRSGRRCNRRFALGDFSLQDRVKVCSSALCPGLPQCCTAVLCKHFEISLICQRWILINSAKCHYSTQAVSHPSSCWTLLCTDKACVSSNFFSVGASLDARS